MLAVHAKRIFSQNSKSCTDFFRPSRLPVFAMRDHAGRTFDWHCRVGRNAAGTRARCGESGRRSNRSASLARFMRADAHWRICLDFLEVYRRDSNWAVSVSRDLLARFADRQRACIAHETPTACGSCRSHLAPKSTISNPQNRRVKSFMHG
jgi:hypothetical protein